MSEKVTYVKPVTITDSMQYESIVDLPDLIIHNPPTVYDVPPQMWDIAEEYAFGAIVGVLHLNADGVTTNHTIDIYRSNFAEINVGILPPAAQWTYISSCQEEYSPSVTYALGDKVYDPSTKYIYESLENNNYSRPLEPTENPTWVATGKTTLALPAFWDAGTTYGIGDLIYVYVQGFNFGVPEPIVSRVMRSTTAGNIGNSPFPNTSGQWEDVPSYPVPYLSDFNWAKGRVVKDESNNTYMSLQDVNKNVPFTNTPAWLKIRPSNRYAMFDPYTNTQTKANELLSITIAAPNINSIGLLNITGATVSIRLRNSAGIVLFQKSITTDGSTVSNAWEYYFTDPTVKIRQIFIPDLPSTSDAFLEVEITGNGEVGLGNLIIGSTVELGYAEYGLTSDITDFSKKVTDDFGRTTFVKRGFKRNLEMQMLIPNTDLNRVESKLEDIRSTPVLVIASDNPYYTETVLRYCFYKTFRTEISYPTFAFVSIQFEGLI